jgi:hypothetical protein
LARFLLAIQHNTKMKREKYLLIDEDNPVYLRKYTVGENIVFATDQSGHWSKDFPLNTIESLEYYSRYITKREARYLFPKAFPSQVKQITASQADITKETESSSP